MTFKTFIKNSEWGLRLHTPLSEGERRMIRALKEVLQRGGAINIKIDYEDFQTIETFNVRKQNIPMNRFFRSE